MCRCQLTICTRVKNVVTQSSLKSGANHSSWSHDEMNRWPIRECCFARILVPLLKPSISHWEPPYGDNSISDTEALRCATWLQKVALPTWWSELETYLVQPIETILGGKASSWLSLPLALWVSPLLPRLCFLRALRSILSVFALPRALCCLH